MSTVTSRSSNWLPCWSPTSMVTTNFSHCGLSLEIESSSASMLAVVLVAIETEEYQERMGQPNLSIGA